MLDWQNEDDYEFVTNLEGRLIAWEFLRRNPEYAKDYSYTLSLSEKEKSLPKIKPLEIYNKELPDYTFWYEPKKLSKETFREWRRRVFRLDIDPGRYRYSEGIKKKWGITGTMPSPKDDNPKIEYLHEPKFLWKAHNDEYSDLFQAVDTGDSNAEFFEQKPGKVTLVFKLGANLETQLKLAEDILKEEIITQKIKKTHNKGQKKVNKKNLITYLRVLDAMNQGVGNKDIIANLPINIPKGSDKYYPDKTLSRYKTNALKLLDPNSYQSLLNIL